MTPPEPDPAKPTEPAIRLSLGWPSGIRAELAVDRGRIRRFLQRFWFAPLAERLLLVGVHVNINVADDDSGRLACSLVLANFCFAKIIVASVHVDFVSIGNGSISDFNPHLEAPEFVLTPRGVGEVAFSHRLGADDIRSLQRFIGKPNSPYSSPTASTGLRGTFGIRHWRGSQQVTFAVTGIVPLLNMYNPSSRSGT